MTPDYLNNILKEGDFNWQIQDSSPDVLRYTSNRGLSEKDAIRYSQILSDHLGIPCNVEDYGATTYRISFTLSKEDPLFFGLPNTLVRQVISNLNTEERTQLRKLSPTMSANIDLLEKNELRAYINEIVNSLNLDKYSSQIDKIKEILNNVKLEALDPILPIDYIRATVCDILDLKSKLSNKGNFNDFMANKTIWRIIFNTLPDHLWRDIFLSKIDSFGDDIEFIKEAVSKAEIWQSLPDHLKNDREILKVAIITRGNIPQAFINDKEVLKNFIYWKPSKLSDIPYSSRDLELAETAVRESWWAINYVPSNIQHNQKLLIITAASFLARGHSYQDYPTNLGFNSDEEVLNALREISNVNSKNYDSQLARLLEYYGDIKMDFAREVRSEFNNIIDKIRKEKARKNFLKRILYGWE